MKEHEKLCQKMVSEIVGIFIGSHLSLWKDIQLLIATRALYYIYWSYSYYYKI